MVKEKLFLITGHPRCGSGFMSNLFRQLGFDIGHEKLGQDGVSSWLMAVKDLNAPWGDNSSSYYVKFNYLILYVRNPQDALPSILLENEVERSLNFRRNYILRQLDFDINQFSHPLDKAIAYFLGLNKIIELQKPDQVVKV
ncbi:MAG: hypothetical protein F6J90_01995 [Moorea sp. SIOASIH]|uniref:hypothetical protein n=1 Tax=Moorena sp. SIOASIH TaxID=2607817 RepID=UPI0013BCF19E|nr:hypothetical protein [Moorena sp. SIOASIH]NEO35141.1 hypothetical protein [Moorena sp. SIOASIH]